MYHQDGTSASQINIITTFSPDIIEEEIVKYLKGMKLEPKVNDKKYKISFDYEAPDENVKNKNYKVSLCIKILKANETADDQSVCIEFTKLTGQQDKYRKLVDDLKSAGCFAACIS